MPIEVLNNPLQQYFGSFSRGLLTTGLAGSAILSASTSGYIGSLADFAAVSPFDKLSIN